MVYRTSDCYLIIQILKGAPVVEGRPGASMPLVDFIQLKKDLAETLGNSTLTDKDVVSAAMYPKEFEEFYRFRQEYGPVDKLDTPTFLVGPDIAHEIEVRLVLIYVAPHLCSRLLYDHINISYA